jgi:hypothetical protein
MDGAEQQQPHQAPEPPIHRLPWTKVGWPAAGSGARAEGGSWARNSEKRTSSPQALCRLTIQARHRLERQFIETGHPPGCGTQTVIACPNMGREPPFGRSTRGGPFIGQFWTTYTPRLLPRTLPRTETLAR